MESHPAAGLKSRGPVYFHGNKAGRQAFAVLCCARPCIALPLLSFVKPCYALLSLCCAVPSITLPSYAFAVLGNAPRRIAPPRDAFAVLRSAVLRLAAQRLC